MADLNVTVQNGGLSISIGGADQLAPLLAGAQAAESGAQAWAGEAQETAEAFADTITDASTFAAALTRAVANGQQTLKDALPLFTTGVAWDFPSESFVMAGAVKANPGRFSALAAARASTALALTAAGAYQTFAANAVRSTDKGLLLEGAATNLFSTAVGDAPAWSKNACTVAASTVLAPVTPAETSSSVIDAIETSDSASHFLNYTFATAPSAGTYTYSVALARADKRYTMLFVTGGGLSVAIGCSIDWDAAGGPTIQQTSGAAAASSIAKPVPLANGFYRFAFVVTTLSTASLSLRIYGAVDLTYANCNYAGTAGTKMFRVWHRQFETGSVATSPILTGGATRSADSAILTRASQAKDQVTVNYAGETGLTTTASFMGSALASLSQINLTTDDGAPWFGKYITGLFVSPAATDVLKWSPLPPESGFVAAICDLDDHLIAGFDTDFKPIVPGAVSVSTGGPKANASYVVDTVLDGSNQRQLRSQRRADGKRIQLTSVGNNVEPSFDPDGYVLFLSDPTNSGAYQDYWMAADGSGSPAPMLPDATIYGIGDSTTFGIGDDTQPAYGWTPKLAAISGRTVVNWGIPSQTTTQMAARQGGVQSLLTVTGNSIPASGAVAVTAISIEMLSTEYDTDTRTLTGTLAGVHGTLTRTATDKSGTTESYSFTRTTAGSAVSCPANTPFIPDQGITARGSVQVLFGGTNDLLYGAAQGTVLANYIAMSAYQSSYVGGRLWISVLNRSTEPQGSANFTWVQTENASLAAAAAAHGAAYLDLRGYLCTAITVSGQTTTQAMVDAGLTPTADDLTDIGNNVIPRSLRSEGTDPIHPNGIGYETIAGKINATLTDLGF